MAATGCCRVEQALHHVAVAQQCRVPAQTPGQGEGAVQFQLASLLVVKGCQAGRSGVGLVVGVARSAGRTPSVHRHHRPWRAASLGQARTGPHQVIRLALTIDRDQYMALHGQVRLTTRRAFFAQVAVDMLGHGLHGQLAQCREIGRGEECRQRLARLVRQVHLALIETLDQLLRGQVHQADVAQVFEHRVRNRLVHAHASDLVHHVVEAFQMLHVDRGVDVDPCVEQLFDVLPTPLMATARRVAVGQFVDQHRGRSAGQQPVEVHLFQRAALVGHPQTRPVGNAFGHGLGFGASMGLDDPHQHIDTLALQLAGPGQHGVGLAYAWRSAQEYDQAPGSLPTQRIDQRIGLFCVV